MALPSGGCFDDNIIVLNSCRQGSLMRQLPAIGMAFGRRELVGDFGIVEEQMMIIKCRVRRERCVEGVESVEMCKTRERA